MPGSSPVEQLHALVTKIGKTLQSIADTNIDPTQKTLFHDTSHSAVQNLKDLLLMFKPETIVNHVAISPHLPLAAASPLVPKTRLLEPAAVYPKPPAAEQRVYNQ